MGWQQQFQKCYGKLMLRVGGPGGPLIHWPDRGQGGQFTWTAGDPEGEIRDISVWAGDVPCVRLYALVLEGGAPEDPLCEMSTLYDGEERLRWRFDSGEDHEILR